MRVRRILIVVGILSLAGLLLWEARRAALAWLLVRGDYARLERWGGDDYFMAAVRRCPRDHRLFSELIRWADHYYRPRFHHEEISDLAWLPTNEVMLLLRETDPDGDLVCRLVILDPSCADSVVADSGRIELNGWDMDVGHFSAWKEAAVLLRGGGTQGATLVFRREGRRFVPLPRRTDSDGDPFFFSKDGVEFVDLDDDGIPEIRTVSDLGMICGTCGRESERRVHTYKLFAGGYYRWLAWGEDCGPDCAIPSSN